MIIQKFNIFNESLDSKNRVQDTANRIIQDSKISTWEEMDNNEFTRNVVNRIIDKSARTFKEVKEIKFLMKLELYNVEELKDLLDNLVKIEEYEKCQKIKNKIDSLLK
jgi:hypothetical protein